MPRHIMCWGKGIAATTEKAMSKVRLYMTCTALQWLNSDLSLFHCVNATCPMWHMLPSEIEYNCCWWTRRHIVGLSLSQAHQNNVAPYKTIY